MLPYVYNTKEEEYIVRIEILVQFCFLIHSLVVFQSIKILGNFKADNLFPNQNVKTSHKYGDKDSWIKYE